jgi:hypothetical protein
MAVQIRNESPVPLVWDRDKLESGDWTAPWFPSSASPIAPGATAEWRAEGISPGRQVVRLSVYA